MGFQPVLSERHDFQNNPPDTSFKVCSPQAFRSKKRLCKVYWERNGISEMMQTELMTVDELFERISKVHVGETDVSAGYSLEPDPCPNWLWRLEWSDRLTLGMLDFFFVAEMGFSPANYYDLTPYAEDNPLPARYCKWRPTRSELGSYYSNHWFLEWLSAGNQNAYQLHLLAAPRDSDMWKNSKFDLDTFLTWGSEDLRAEDCHFLSPGLSQWRLLVEHIGKLESGPDQRSETKC